MTDENFHFSAVNPDGHLPLHFATTRDTVGVSVFCKGVMMTGSAVRELGGSYDLNDGSPQKCTKMKIKKLKREKRQYKGWPCTWKV